MDTRHFASAQDSKLLSMKNAEPWQIVRNIDNKAYKLEIFQQMKDASLTLIFHPQKLHLAPGNAFPGQILKLRPFIIVNTGGKTHNKWKVLEVVDFCKTKRYGIQYKTIYMSN